MPVTGQTSTTASTACWVPNNQGRCVEDEYEVDNKPIGAGSFGTVRMVVSKHLRERRAMKHIPKTSPDMHLVRTEIEINLTLDHPNIVKLFNVFEDAKYVYLVLEMCQGHDLDNLHGVSVPVPNVAFIMDTLLKALSYLHQQGIVHRDVKPGNLILKTENRPLLENTIKLLDFGMARRFKKGEKSLKTLTGTPIYVAPEIWRGENYNEKCDIWSAGVIMYELLSTVPPFYGSNMEEHCMMVVQQRVTFKHGNWNNINSATKDFVMLLLEKNPDKRISAINAQQHKWLSEHYPLQKPEDKGVNSQEFDNMAAFCVKSRFEKVAITLVAHLLDDSEIQGLQSTFQSLDVDGNGTLSLAEIERGLKETKFSANIQEVFQKVDFTGSSEIEYSTFIASMMDQKYYHKQEHLWRAFKSIDQDNSNCITMKELTKALESIAGQDAPVNPEEAKNIMRQTDTNGDGLISFEEFAAMLCGTPGAGRRGAQQKLTQALKS